MGKKLLLNILLRIMSSWVYTIALLDQVKELSNLIWYLQLSGGGTSSTCLLGYTWIAACCRKWHIGVGTVAIY